MNGAGKLAADLAAATDAALSVRMEPAVIVSHVGQVCTLQWQGATVLAAAPAWYTPVNGVTVILLIQGSQRRILGPA